MTLDKFIHFTVPHSLHLWNGNNLWESGETFVWFLKNMHDVWHIMSTPQERLLFLTICQLTCHENIFPVCPLPSLSFFPNSDVTVTWRELKRGILVAVFLLSGAHPPRLKNCAKMLCEQYWVLLSMSTQQLEVSICEKISQTENIGLPHATSSTRRITGLFVGAQTSCCHCVPPTRTNRTITPSSDV